MILRRFAMLMPLLFILAACNITTPLDVTPTVEILITETLTPEVSPTPSPTPSLSATVTLEATPITMLTPVQIATQPPVVEPQNQPTLPPTVETISCPYQYVVQTGDTLGVVLQKQPWGYANAYDPGLQKTVVSLNGMFSADVMPAPGTTLLIPCRTPTPVPEGNNETQAAAPGPCGQIEGNLCIPANTIFDCYPVEEGDTIVAIADNFATSLEVLSAKNQNLNWSGCDFTQPSGGPGCNPLISIGQCVNVPFPTATPVPTMTPSGAETATPTPTFAPARPVYPPEGAVAPPGIFTLQWVSAGILKAEEFYLVEVQDVTAGVTTPPWVQVTRDTSMGLPASLIPIDKQTHQFQWRVSVAKKDAGGAFVYIGGLGAWRSFQWQSR